MKSIDFKVILGIITVALAFIVFPIILEATDDILANANISNYTGLSAIVKIAPMIVMVAILFGGGILVFQGVKATRTRCAAAPKQTTRRK